MTLSILILIIFIALILFRAIGDGLFDIGNKREAQRYKDVETFLFLVIPYIYHIETLLDLLTYILAYAFIRFAIFDYARNIVAGDKITHIGITKDYDKLLRKFKAPWWGWLFAKIIFLTVGISLIFKFL